MCSHCKEVTQITYHKHYLMYIPNYCGNSTIYTLDNFEIPCGTLVHKLFYPLFQKNVCCRVGVGRMATVKLVI